MKPIVQTSIPDAETFSSLTPPELGGVILEQLCTCGLRDQNLHLRNFTGEFTGNSRDSPYPEKDWDLIIGSISEAWAWLIAQGFIAPRADGGDHGWVFVTRLGRRAATAQGVKEYRKALELPKDKLHPAIAERRARALWSGHGAKGFWRYGAA